MGEDRGGARIILLLGAPGSGKGTQSSLLASRFGMETLSTGAMLREEARRPTKAGFRLRRILAAGALVEDGLVCEAVASRLGDLQTQAGRGGPNLILDGFPRTVGQAQKLNRMLEGLNIPAPLVLHLDVPHTVLRERLECRRECAKCGKVYSLAADRPARSSRCEIDGGALVERDDDGDGIVTRRLAAYEEATLPVLDYYRSCNFGGYRTVDGNRAPAEIAKELREIVEFADTAVAA